MVISIVQIHESEHLYKAEIQVLMLWLYFTHACLMRANSYFVLGLMCILTILNRVEKKFDKNNKNKTITLVLFVIFGVCFFYLKDNFKFQTFFYLTDEIME